MTTASLQSTGYLPVATATLHPNAVLDCDLYIRRPGCSLAELYRSRDYPLERGDIEVLRDTGVDQLYIRLEEADGYRTYLCQHVLRQREIPVTARIAALREVTRVAFQDALGVRDCQKAVEAASQFGRHLVQTVADDSLLFRELFATLEHDFGAFTHACNVSVYSALIARGLGICSSDELPELAAGALLHDIGKRQMPRFVLNKTGRLTDEEWELIRQHPVLGFQELTARGDRSWGQLMMVYQHHERLDGSGYPTGIGGDEIHPWARICAVANAFESRTSHRPYRRSSSAKEGCDYLSKNARTKYDREAVACWIDQVQPAD